MLAGLMRRTLKTTGTCAAFWALAAFARAADPGTAAAPGADSPVITAPATAAAAVEKPERHWRLGVALGYGERTNPLIQSKKIPVLVDVDIAWFGERWFFDNGDVGF